MLDAYAPIFARHRPYLVAAAALQERLAPDPLGLAVGAAEHFDPMRSSSATFLGLLQRLDALTYGPLGLTMPRWAFYDCAELPGAIFGLGAPVSDVAPRVRRALGVPAGHDGLVPLSMCIAIPMLQPSAWLGYTLCSLNEVSPGASPPGMRCLTLAFALAALGVRSLTATTQWASPKLRVWARFAPLRVLASWLPAHSEPATLVFRFGVDPRRIARSLDEAVPRDETEAVLLDVADEGALRRLQHEIEDGAEVVVAGAPRERGARICVPLRHAGRS